jgi:hypothetical protein
MTYLLNHIALSLFNLINSRIDAYRVLKDKTIAHGINLSAYLIFCAVVAWLYMRHIPWGWLLISEIIVFAVSAFCNRQFTFDIPLNLRRGKKWDYVSLDKPPKAWLDRIEIMLFGYNGRAPLVMYGLVFIICSVIKMVWL